MNLSTTRMEEEFKKARERLEGEFNGAKALEAKLIALYAHAVLNDIQVELLKAAIEENDVQLSQVPPQEEFIAPEDAQ